MRKFFLLSCLFLSIVSSYSVASDARISAGASIMGHVFSEYDSKNFLVKHRDDKKFIGVLFLDDNNIGHTIRVFNAYTQELVFEITDKEKKFINFVFKKDAVIISYKSAFWGEKIAYDLYTGRVVRRYSSWLGYNK